MTIVIYVKAPGETPERWSAVRKTDVVLRLLKGEAIDAVSRETQVPAHELEEWRRVFLESGTHGLTKRIDPEDRELRRVQAKLGEVMVRERTALLARRPVLPQLRGSAAGHRLVTRVTDAIVNSLLIDPYAITTYDPLR
jgi:transposase